MMCKMCQERGTPDNFASTLKCAFVNGVFQSENWNCATMNALRDICGNYKNPNEDQYAEILCASPDAECTHIVLTWYKRRGKTEGAWMLFDNKPPQPLTITEAQNIIATNQRIHRTLNSGAGDVKRYNIWR